MRGIAGLGAGALLLLGGLLLMPIAASAETIELATRPGVSVRVVLVRPSGPPIGSVILLAGGAGRLDIAADGTIGRGSGNHLVRSRALYAQAGFVTAVPDIAAGFKTHEDVTDDYRWSAEHAADLGALVVRLRAIRAPVHIVGTSRGAVSVANAVARLSGAARPDSFVISSGVLMHVDGRLPSVEANVPALRGTRVPGLLVAHRQDACRFTPARDMPRFRRWLGADAPIEEISVDGGGPPRGEPCGARHFHGFEGIDGEVTRRIADWLRSRSAR